MNMKILLTMIILLMIGVSSAQDIRMVILNPQSVFTVNQSEPINYYVGVQNKNNVNITINIVSPTTKNILNFNSPQDISLKPNETSYINFTIKAEHNETISIPVSFSNGNQTGTLSQTIIVKVIQPITSTPQSSGGSSSSSGSKSNLIKNQTNVQNDSKVNYTDKSNPTKPKKNDMIPTLEKESEKKESNWSFIWIIVVIVLSIIMIFIYLKIRKKSKVTLTNAETS